MRDGVSTSQADFFQYRLSTNQAISFNKGYLATKLFLSIRGIYLPSWSLSIQIQDIYLSSWFGKGRQRRNCHYKYNWFQSTGQPANRIDRIHKKRTKGWFHVTHGACWEFHCFLFSLSFMKSLYGCGLNVLFCWELLLLIYSKSAKNKKLKKVF